MSACSNCPGPNVVHQHLMMVPPWMESEVSFEPVDHDGDDDPRKCCSPYGKDDIWFGLAALVVLVVIGVAVGMVVS